MVTFSHIPLYRTLTFKVAMALIVFFIFNGVVLVLWNQSDVMQDLETDIQTVYRNTAFEISEALQNSKTDQNNLSVFFDSLAQFYPGMELFLVNPKGEILEHGSYVPSQLINQSVPIEAIELFLNADSSDYPIEMPIPTATDLDFVFSAAPLGSPDNPDAYILVTLVEGGEDVYISWWEEYGAILTRTVLFSIIIAVLAGILFWYFLTRRVQRVAQAVQNYRAGDSRIVLNDNSSDEIGHVAMHIGDMMERIDAMFNELGKKEKMRTELLASVSHELQTPLTVMQGNIETLVEHREKMSEADLSQKLGAVYTQVRHMSALIDDLFDVAILETGQMRINTEPFPMVELVEDVLQSYTLLLDQAKLVVERNFPETIQTVNADPLRIRQVIRNLLSNAIKFSSPGGRIRITTEVSSNEILTFRIEDTGVGIAEEDISKIFESFYRSNQQLHKTVKGTGLGLHICQHILKLHNSNLEVRSRLDIGTTFSFDLDLYKEVVTI
ncbi:MAG: HAMP domain-containing histidine kinase [Candidatus Marinimicrobia bacterium]|nr:HAMP domain-containing histidine kinase [Candidatus Neomarinimicrobiota bacterium]MCF7921719.1 HAMP domain-containing histidine kinase [Candidatus Neomarinimicrobiota bacterium]